MGSFSYNPMQNIVGSLLDEASLATAPNSSVQTHRKSDNTGYAFRGRSYGVGATVGLDAASIADNVQQFTYLEDGYVANVTCWYNHTMNFHVSLRSNIAEFNTYEASGFISNGDYENVGFPGFDDSEVVAILGNPYKGQYQWGMAVGRNASRYAALNQTACEVFFNPTKFAVSVDTVQKLINVTATKDPAQNIDPSATRFAPSYGRLTSNCVQQIGALPQAVSSAIFTPLGNGRLVNTVIDDAADGN